MKKIDALLLALSMVLFLCACGHEHSWVEATCTEPKTCSSCGETEGEALGHSWIDATCTEPKTCSRCGETEGEALGHSPTQADYWDPSICTVCGAELAPRVEPELLKNLPGTFMEVGKTYDYHTVCYYNNSIDVVVELEVTDYYTTKGNGRDLKIIDGYEWRAVTLRGIASGPEVWQYYTSQHWWWGDLYDLEQFDESYVDGGTGYSTSTIRWKGEEYPCYYFYDASRDDYEVTQSRGFIHTCYVCVPEGYDGVFIALTNSKNYTDQVDKITEAADEDTLYFRLS